MSIQVHTIYTWFVSAYLITGDSGLYLVDAAYPWSVSTIQRAMERLGRADLRLIFITHAHVDHYGSAAALRRLTGAPIAVHRADAPAIAAGRTPVGMARGSGKLGEWLLRVGEPYLRLEPTPPDILLDDVDDLSPYGLDASVVHIPGHTPGSSCLFVEGRLAFVGDLLTNNGHPVLQRRYAHDWSLIPASLARVQRLRPQWIYGGHARRPIPGEALQSL